MIRIEKEELKKIQVSMLVDIHNFCEKNDLQYFLAYGTLLGAIRHHGYIPWDDDIDICMPRPDYERFLSSYKDENKIYKVYSTRTSDSYMLPYAKVSDERTIMNEKMYRQDEFGVYIDVFPLDAYHDKCQIIVSKLLSQFLNTKKAILNKSRSIQKRIIMWFGKCVLFFLSIKNILKLMERVAVRYPYGSTDYVEVFCSSTVNKEMAPISFFSTSIKCQFEGYEFNVPCKYDEYLHILYGDYMKFPPVEQRQSTHIFEAWWK